VAGWYGNGSAEETDFEKREDNRRMELVKM
jgi:hypothetical protein